MANPLLDTQAGGTHLLLGNEAIVRGALEAGVDIVTCYPGTPSSEAPDTFYRLSPEGPYQFEYSVNEKVALEVAGGASLAGAKALCTMKHVGVNVAADPLMTLAYVGAPGALVLLSADDPGCHSSQNEQDNRYYARLGNLPCLEPATAQEAKDMARDAFALSRELSIPVMLRTTTRLNHLRGPVEFGPLPEREPVKGFQKDPRKFVPVPANARPMRLALLDKMDKVRRMGVTSHFNIRRGEGEPLGVIASGVVRNYLHDALLESPVRASVLELGLTHPLPRDLLAEFLRSNEKVLVLEELEPIVETEVRALAQELRLSVEILGKDQAGLPLNGEYSTFLAKQALAVLGGEPAPEAQTCQVSAQLPPRPPNLCAGCSHRAAYYATRRVFGDEPVYSSDIGCYTLGILPPLSMADFLLCMGSSVSSGSGVSWASGRPVVAFIGDSTFFHSGITGLLNAVHNGRDLLLVVLDNRTTAMTGHQPHPGVDQTVLGANPRKADIEQIVRALGVEQVAKVRPMNLKATTKALEALKAASGVRVLIAEEPCALFARRVLKTKRPKIAQVAESCDNCGECLATLACPAFVVEDGRTAINPLACSGCMFCLQICEHIKPASRS
ncbi:MAG: indolepyruvate ferredoxin oxidoreductase subunit alpha [Desulfovibrionaceae bacterium]